MRFIICELLWISRNTLLSVAKDVPALKQHITHRSIFLTVYSLSIVLFFKNSFSKASMLLFTFVCVSVGHAHFSTDEIRISCEPDRPTWVFFSCKTAVNMARKAWFEVCGKSLCTVFNPERNLPLSKSLPVRKRNTGFI